MSRLGLLGGTTDSSGVEERSEDAHGENTSATESRRRAASGLVESHDAVFRRTARRYSIGADDAEDAYQRALEILLTKAPPIEGDALVRWMQTVTKREALAVRRQRERLLGSPRTPSHDDADRDPLDFIASESPGPNDQLARRERVARSGEALQALKPQEVRALTLKAQGYSYAEIGEMTGWSYTKINRCMAEGRKRFLQVFADIEQGRRCEELATALSAFADGEGANGLTDAVEFHLRSCATCRAKLRAYRAVPGKVFDLLPAGPILDHSMGGGPHEWIVDRAAAAVDKVREAGYSLLARGGGGGSGEATALATAGGTRGAGVAAVAKVLAICGATAAGGATCVATGLVDPGAVGGGQGPDRQKPAVERPAKPIESPVSHQQPTEQPPTETPAAPKAESPPAAVQQPTPAEQKTRQFSFESSAAPSSSSSSSGGEFGGPSGGGGGGSSSGGEGSGGGFGIEG